MHTHKSGFAQAESVPLEVGGQRPDMPSKAKQGTRWGPCCCSPWWSWGAKNGWNNCGMRCGPEGAGWLGERMALQPGEEAEPRRGWEEVDTGIRGLGAGHGEQGRGREQRHRRMKGPKDGERPHMANWENQKAQGMCPCPPRTQSIL